MLYERFGPVYSCCLNVISKGVSYVSKWFLGTFSINLFVNTVEFFFIFICLLLDPVYYLEPERRDFGIIGMKPPDAGILSASNILDDCIRF